MKIFVQWNLTQEMNFESDGRAKKKRKKWFSTEIYFTIHVKIYN